MGKERVIISFKEKIYILIFIILLVLFFNYQNNSLQNTTITINDTTLPDEFSGFRIVQLSDMHSKMFGKKGETLIKNVSALNPDIIVMTGDMLDGNIGVTYDFTDFLGDLSKIAACYYISGEEELHLNEENENYLYTVLEEYNIKLLNNERTEILSGQAAISITGIVFEKTAQNNNKIITEKLSGIYKKYGSPSGFGILLAHYPDYLAEYSKFEYRVIIAGHNHGGQFRLPVIGGVISPDGKPFPAYDSGYFLSSNKKSMMIVNRGLGNSEIPQRILNRPEIVLIVLK